MSGGEFGSHDVEFVLEGRLRPFGHLAPRLIKLLAGSAISGLFLGDEFVLNALQIPVLFVQLADVPSDLLGPLVGGRTVCAPAASSLASAPTPPLRTKPKLLLNSLELLIFFD